MDRALCPRFDPAAGLLWRRKRQPSAQHNTDTQTTSLQTQAIMPVATKNEFWPNTKPLSLSKPKAKEWPAPKSLQEAHDSGQAMNAFLRNNEPRYIQTLTPETVIEKAKAIALFRVQMEADLAWYKALKPAKLGDPKTPEGQRVTNSIAPAIDYLEEALAHLDRSGRKAHHR